MMHDDVTYLRHILDAVLRIEEYLAGVDEEEFYGHYLVQDGVIRQLETSVRQPSEFHKNCARKRNTFRGPILLG